MPNDRLSYAESCERFKPDYISETPPLLDRMPRYDDEELGLSFFKMLVGVGGNFSNLTMPRTYFGRCEVNEISFQNSDLSQSVMCWNDFVSVDFTGADLSGADLRASWFREVSFESANLKGADLRHSTFESCMFENAEFENAILSRSQRRDLALTTAQKKLIDWRWRKGSLPEGG